ncbi:MAG: Phosphoribosylglycinamide formyltransferase [Phycisphaerae bacterium]|nr:Phosphoribosylglycinamide formyltransferase [Phycisphaerae bacterium]
MAGITPSLPIAVLLSGDGTTLQNFIKLQRNGKLPIDIRLVISSRPGVKGLKRAAAANIFTRVIQRPRPNLPGVEGFSPRGVTDEANLFSKQITDAVHECGAELVCMAGFLNMWSIPPDFEGRTMNVHPALLPMFGGKGFYGDRVHEAVLAAGCKVSGCSIHFADNQYDNGPIILQRAVPVKESDTPHSLGQRVRRAERLLYPEAIRLFAAGRLQIINRRVRILPE